MNAFREHHENSIRFAYRCFDRILLNGLIQPFQQPERVIGFFNTYRSHQWVSRDLLRGIANDYHRWVEQHAQARDIPIVSPPEGRRDEFVDQYFRRAQPDRVVVILKAREPARMLLAIGNPKDNRWHLTFGQRWVIQYNFYVYDREWGRMFVRMCPYFPFSARICLNQHHWIAARLRAEGIAFQQCANAFLRCADPMRLQAIADSLSPTDLLRCGQKWLTAFTPFFTAAERRQAGCQHRLFFSQVECCDNLIFRRRAALDRLEQRLLDANRTIGQPNKITVIFGRKVTRRYRGQLQTVIEDLDLPNPVIRSHYGHGFVKQYVRDHVLLRTEPSTNHVGDYGIKKAVDNLPALRAKLNIVVDNYLNVQQDILETFVDRGQLRELAAPTILPNGKRLPGLKLDHPRLLALMHAVVRFAHVPTGYVFTTRDLYPATLAALGATVRPYTLASLRYDLAKLRGKGLVDKLPHSRRYRLRPEGYRICVVFLKLFERIYAPLAAGLLDPVGQDSRLARDRRAQLDALYQRVLDDLDRLLAAVGLRVAA